MDQFAPLPSVRTQEVSKKFRSSLLICLAINLFWYMIGAQLAAGDIAAVDLLLLLLGYLAQDLCRPQALRLYCTFTITAIVIDTIVFLTKFFGLWGTGNHGVLIVLSILFVGESVGKVGSLFYGKQLITELLRVPGQSSVPSSVQDV